MKNVYITQKAILISEVFKYAVLDSIGNIKFFPIDTKKTITTHSDGNPGASSLFESKWKVSS